MLVLHHEVAVLAQNPQGPVDRARFAALLGCLPAPLRGHRMVTRKRSYVAAAAW